MKHRTSPGAGEPPDEEEEEEEEEEESRDRESKSSHCHSHLHHSSQHCNQRRWSDSLPNRLRSASNGDSNTLEESIPSSSFPEVNEEQGELESEPTATTTQTPTQPSTTTQEVLTQLPELTQFGDEGEYSGFGMDLFRSSSAATAAAAATKRPTPWGRLLPCGRGSGGGSSSGMMALPVDLLPRDSDGNAMVTVLAAPSASSLSCTVSPQQQQQQHKYKHPRPGDLFNEYTLGRSTKCDVSLSPPGAGPVTTSAGDVITAKLSEWVYGMVSNKHARIYCLMSSSVSSLSSSSSSIASSEIIPPSIIGTGGNSGYEVYVEDTSNNGTLVNGTTVLRRREKRLLHSGDEICLVNPTLVRKKVRSTTLLQHILTQYSYVYVAQQPLLLPPLPQTTKTTTSRLFHPWQPQPSNAWIMNHDATTASPEDQSWSGSGWSAGRKRSRFEFQQQTHSHHNHHHPSQLLSTHKPAVNPRATTSHHHASSSSSRLSCCDSILPNHIQMHMQLDNHPVRNDPSSSPAAAVTTVMRTSHSTTSTSSSCINTTTATSRTSLARNDTNHSDDVPLKPPPQHASSRSMASSCNHVVPPPPPPPLLQRRISPRRSTSLSPPQRRIEEVYDMRDLLGSGTVGEVRRAIERQTGIARAVKIISFKHTLHALGGKKGAGKAGGEKSKNKNSNGSQSIQSSAIAAATAVLTAEASLLQKLDHPYIVQLVDVFTSPTAVYLVMELLSGGDLFDRIVAKGRYEETPARRVMRRLLSAIYYLHEEQNIVHRDLKPENILLMSAHDDVQIKLTDFGVAKQTTVGGGGLKTFCGTPLYFAPEILHRRNTLAGRGRYNKQADQWSLGVILYVLLSGTPPFDDTGDDPWRMHSGALAPLSHNSLSPPSSKRVSSSTSQCQPSPWIEFPKEFWNGVSESAKDLIRRMLTIDPKQRITIRDACSHPWILVDDGDTHCHPLDDPNVRPRPLLLSNSQSLRRNGDTSSTTMLPPPLVIDHPLHTSADSYHRSTSTTTNLLTEAPTAATSGNGVSTVSVLKKKTPVPQNTQPISVHCDDSIGISPISNLPKKSCKPIVGAMKKSKSLKKSSNILPLSTSNPTPAARCAPIVNSCHVDDFVGSKSLELSDDEIFSQFTDQTESISSFGTPGETWELETNAASGTTTANTAAIPCDSLLKNVTKRIGSSTGAMIPSSVSNKENDDDGDMQRPRKRRVTDSIKSSNAYALATRASSRTFASCSQEKPKLTKAGTKKATVASSSTSHQSEGVKAQAIGKRTFAVATQQRKQATLSTWIKRKN